ncbi:MAG: ribose-phosphate pyrophosphokinase-like domain-containing protein [Planctomycetaceae bacterium]
MAILCGSGNPQFATRIAPVRGGRLIPSPAQFVSEGNKSVRVLKTVRGQDSIVVQGVHRPVHDNFVDLLFRIDA